MVTGIIHSSIFFLRGKVSLDSIEARALCDYPLTLTVRYLQRFAVLFNVGYTI